MANSGRILFVYMLFVYVQRCNSLQSSSLFTLSASGNPTLACNCTLGVAIINLNKYQVFSCQLMPLWYSCIEKLLNYYNGMKNCHSKSHSSISVQKNMFFEFLKMHGRLYLFLGHLKGWKQKIMGPPTLPHTHTDLQGFVPSFCTLCIGNSMVSSAIWKKHARVSFSKTIKIARVRRTSTI